MSKTDKQVIGTDFGEKVILPFLCNHTRKRNSAVLESRKALKEGLVGIVGWTPKEIAETINRLKDAGEETPESYTNKDGNKICYDFHYRGVYFSVCFEKDGKSGKFPTYVFSDSIKSIR